MRIAHEYPEDWEDRIEAMLDREVDDAVALDQDERACKLCGSTSFEYCIASNDPGCRYPA